MKSLTKQISILTVICLTLSLAGTAGADWDEGDPYKWLQRPDLSTMGIDVNAYFDIDPTELEPRLLILADDFLCTSTEPITDIHIWGSWRHDVLPQRFDPNAPGFFVPDPSLVSFRLSIHSDTPAVVAADGTVLEHSRPDELLWEGFFDPGTFAVRKYADNLYEGWLDPLSGYYELPGDTICWQYNFLFDEAEPSCSKAPPPTR